jgi:hypothetical protein
MHWVLTEERNDRLDQVPSSTHHVAIQVLRVVVASLVRDDRPHAEEVDELAQTHNASRALCHRKLVRHLIAGFVAFPARSIRLSNEADGEAALSVYKANHPTKLNQPFLLVFCTHDVVTVPPAWDGTRSLGYSGFPAYSQMRTARLPVRGATIYLRTVPSVTTRALLERPTHFWWALMVAHESGLSHLAPGLEDELGV